MYVLLLLSQVIARTDSSPSLYARRLTLKYGAAAGVMLATSLSEDV